jgi:hypothetical protein
MIKTEFFKDFCNYYEKASHLELKNLNKYVGMAINDPLMENVTIYDTVHRRQAGFSKALEDIHGVRQRKDLVRYADFSKRIDSTAFQFLHLFHRFTGSGASFQPTILPDGSRNPKEHGYHNNHVQELASLIALRGDDGIACAREYISTCVRPMVTSVGNQPPSLKNGNPSKYRLAQQYYFDNYAESFVKDYLTFLLNKEYFTDRRAGIKDGVDFSCAWHKSRGFKQWHFVLTAFVMDTAEYYPELVDPESHCYYGANCVKSFDLMFTKEKSDPRNKAEYQEACMNELCKAVQGRPYDVEDVCCDYIRYVKEYIPKGYDHLTSEQSKNNSTLKVDGVYPLEVQQRITEVIG